MKPFAGLNVVGAFLIAGCLAVSAAVPENTVEPANDGIVAQTDAALDSAACVASGGDLVNGTSVEAKQSAEATAQKTLMDPNNQLGTSLQGSTPGPVQCVTIASADTSSDETLE